MMVEAEEYTKALSCPQSTDTNRFILRKQAGRSFAPVSCDICVFGSGY